MAGESILVVDDERVILRILEFNLKKQGYQVRMAANGSEAMQKTRESKPDLILLDVMMPEMDGFQVCREIRADPQLQDVLIIMLTAKGQEIDKDTAEEAGANLYFTKPFSPATLIGSVRELLDSRENKSITAQESHQDEQ